MQNKNDEAPTEIELLEREIKKLNKTQNSISSNIDTAVKNISNTNNIISEFVRFNNLYYKKNREKWIMWRTIAVCSAIFIAIVSIWLLLYLFL